MTILIAVASKHGSTREIAQAIAEDLRAKELVVDLREAGEIASIDGYDAVMLGSGIYAGSWLPEAKHFAETQRTELARLPVWLFSSGPLGDDPQPHDDPQKLAAPLGDVVVRDHRIFVGKLDRQNLGFGERLIARVVGVPEGDFRDWDAIHAWAGEIAVALAPAVASSDILS
ncbi:MAG: flavodoxin domain-containing protein [Chloroflexi bacterium]|nr:flavodoxin domain-containing protein [Chloroflexota bacterium]